MFDRFRNRNKAPVSQEVTPEEQLPSQEVEAPVEHAEVAESLGATALSKEGAFTTHTVAAEGGGTAELLLPSHSTSVRIEQQSGNDVLVSDSRRFTPETIEADFQAEQERLNKPLELTEAFTALQKVQSELERVKNVLIEDGKGSKYASDFVVTSDDIYVMNSDIAAVAMARDVINGKRPGELRGLEGPDEELSAAELLGRAVESIAEDPTIRNIAENGELSTKKMGYAESNLYYYGRAYQVAKKIEEMPGEFRKKVLEAETPDVSWIVDEPVVVERPPAVSAA